MVGSDASPRLVVAPGCEVAPFGDGIAVLDLNSNTYFSLNESGRIAFEALSAPLTGPEVAERVARHFGIAPEVCADDVAALLDALLAHGLVEMR